MVPLNWQLPTPLDAIIFDCDGTLSQIEGINYLAAKNGVESKVRLLTEKAMSETGITADIYKKRLDLVRPTASQVATVGAAYYAHLSPEADQVITILQQLNKTIYVVSAGIQSAVEDFVKRLQISSAQVFGVDIYFDEQGNYRDYDPHSPMSGHLGKRQVVEKLRLKHRRLAFLGDGMNDIEAASAVDRFIGYGGAYFRKNIANLCDFYIECKSLSPVLPLCLTATEAMQLATQSLKTYQTGMNYINDGLVLIKS